MLGFAFPYTFSFDSRKKDSPAVYFITNNNEKK